MSDSFEKQMQNKTWNFVIKLKWNVKEVEFKPPFNDSHVRLCGGV